MIQVLFYDHFERLLVKVETALIAVLKVCLSELFCKFTALKRLRETAKNIHSESKGEEKLPY